MARSPSAVLRISCPDAPGIVASVSRFVGEHGGNIIHADQHTDRREGLFLQRVEFELDGLRLEREEIGPAFEPLARRIGMSWSLRFSDEVPRTAILVSRLGHCLYDLLARWRLGELRVDIPFVASNHTDLRQVADDFGVPFHHLPVTAENRESQEQRLVELFEDERVELVVLARYMRILGPQVVRSYAGRMINIHHSFLPAFIGARPYHQAHQRGVKIIGASAHYVTEELDEGPIIEQDVARVSHRDSVADMVAKGRDLEQVVLARGVARHVEHRVLVYGNKTVVFD